MMMTLSLRASVLAMVVGSAAVRGSATCPPVEDITPSWTMEMILKDVCKHDKKTDCSEIPGLLDTLKELEPNMAGNFDQAKKALTFFCGECVAPIRSDVIKIERGDGISSSGADQVCHKSGCMDAFEEVAQSFPGAPKAVSDVKSACRKGNRKDAAKAMEAMMNTMMKALGRVRDVATKLGFAKAESSAHTLARHSAGPSPLRLAAYACLAVGAALLVSAAVIHVRSRSPTAFKELQEKEAEML